MYKYVLLSLIMINILFVPSFADHNPKIVMTFLTEQKDFSSEEEIPVNILVLNKGDQCSLISDIGVEYTSASISLLPPDVPIKYILPETFQLLPGDSKKVTVNLKIYPDMIPTNYAIGSFLQIAPCDDSFHNPDFLSGPRLDMTINPPQPNQCMIATAAYASEMEPQVQQLREIRDNTVLSTVSGTAFMTIFHQLYYSFSPTIADFERDLPIFKEAIRILMTPMLSSLSIMTLAENGSETQVLGLGISVIALNLGMYVVTPVLVGFTIHRHFKR